VHFVGLYYTIKNAYLPKQAYAHTHTHTHTHTRTHVAEEVTIYRTTFHENCSSH